MRVKTRSIPGDLTGKVDGLVLYRNKHSNKLFARKPGVFVDHPGQKPFKNAQQAIYVLQPSGAFKQNLRDYLIAYNSLPDNEGREAHSWNNLYNKLMFAMQRQLGIPLATLTHQMITDLNLPCRRVKAAVEAGLLPLVKGYERFGDEM